MQESTATTDRQEAERFLRKRLDARDDGSLSSFLASKNLTFRRVGGLVLGDEVEAAIPFAEDALNEHQRDQAHSTDLR